MRTIRIQATGVFLCVMALSGLAGNAYAGLPPALPITPAPLLSTSGVNPPSQLRSAIAAVEAGGTVTVCIAGDSTSVGTPAGVNSQEGVWPLIQREMIAQNPGVNFSFQNFGIPGSTAGMFLNATAYNTAVADGITWYTSSASNWWQYVRNANCNIVFTNWGVNDSYNVNASTLQSVINFIASGTQNPGIVFITNAIANPLAGSPFNLSTYQTGYISGASLVRSITQTGLAGFTGSTQSFTYNPPQNFGLIDVNRLFQQSVLGEDYTDQTSTNVLSQILSNPITLAPSSAYTFPVKSDGDFEIQVNFLNQYPTIYSSGTVIFFQIAAMDGGTASPTTVYFTPVNSTTASVTYVTGPITVSKNFTVGSSNLNLDIGVKQSYLNVSVNGNTIVSKRIVKPTAPFYPIISTSAGTATITGTVVTYSIGAHRTYNSVLSNSATYGNVPVSANTSVASASGSTTLTFASLPSSVAVGNNVADSTSPASLASNAAVTVVSGGTVTISPAVTVVGVASGDSVGFTTGIPNPNGGNGINHDASGALNFVYDKAFQKANLCLVCYTENHSALASRSTVVSTAGQTVTTTQQLRHLLETPAGSLATLTVALPPYPYDGDIFDQVSTQAISAETVTAGAGPTGTTVVQSANPIAFAIGQTHQWRYNLALNEWIQTQ